MENKKFKEILPYLMVLPSLLITVLFVMYPILNSVIRSFKVSGGSGFTFDNYIYFFTNEIMVKNITYTIFVAFMTVIFTILVAYPFAIYVRFGESKISKFLYNLILIPRFIPGMVAVYAIKQVIGDAGLISRIGALFGMDIQLGFMYTEKGIIYTNLWFNIPFAVLIIGSALSGISKYNLEAAKDVGASNLTIFNKIILPLSYRDSLVAATFVFMSNVGAFTTPYLIGGNSPKMLGVVLNDIFSVYRNYENAAALSVIMFLICSISAGAYIYTNMKRNKWESV